MCGSMRSCLQEGDLAVYWPSPAAGAMRLTARGFVVHQHDRTKKSYVWFNAIVPARKGSGRVLAITRGWRHAAHGLRLRRAPARQNRKIACVVQCDRACKKGMWLCTGNHPRLAPCGSRPAASSCTGTIEPKNRMCGSMRSCLEEGDLAVY
jgi:hypothetical protein